MDEVVPPTEPPTKDGSSDFRFPEEVEESISKVDGAAESFRFETLVVGLRARLNIGARLL